MKSEVLKRSMFVVPLSKNARNSGIMEGFEDEDFEDMDMESQALEEMPPMARTPQNPEILMNNLRGDMRSVDARYMELAQMVGEEAAMETPPEVLAMLQPQFAEQQQPQGGGGITSLPQAAGMAPPNQEQGGMPPDMGGGMMPPDMGGGMPPGMGGGMMPPGMPQEGGMPPFPSSGASQQAPQGFARGGAVGDYPPTPDGMPPLYAQFGALANAGTRAAQFLSSQGAAANAALGRFMSQGFPQTFRPVFENVRGPGGRYTAEQFVTYPTFTEHLSNLAGPTITQLASRFAPGSGAVVGGVTGLGVVGALRDNKSGTGDPARDALIQEYQSLYYNLNERSVPLPILSNLSNDKLVDSVNSLKRRISNRTMPIEVEYLDQPPEETGDEVPMGEPILPVGVQPGFPAARQGPAAVIPAASPAKPAAAPAPLAPQGGPLAIAQGARPERSKSERIKAEAEALLPLYKEFLGEDKESAKVNALLLLADAGLKLAGSRQPTFAMAVSEAASGLPRGFAAILAQSKELEGKIKAGALSQAINDISAQDKFAQALQIEVLKGDFKVLQAQAASAGKISGPIVKDGGMGMRIIESDKGSFLNRAIDPEDPVVKNAITSRFTLRDTDNPFVQNRGPAPTTVQTDPKERINLGKDLQRLDTALGQLDGLMGTYAQLYSPGTWFVDKLNNFIVPISGGLIRPDVNQEKAGTELRIGLQGVLKSIASAQQEGRVSVQEQQWARGVNGAIIEPTEFLKNKELAAAHFNALRTSLKNARQQVMTQLGYIKDDYVMQTPPTGTQNDPFVIPKDVEQQRIMFNYLRGTIGRLQDPRATVYIRTPDNQVRPFSPLQLRNLGGGR